MANKRYSIIQEVLPLILLFLAVGMITSCSDNRSLKDKIPGWYEASVAYDNGDSLIGKVTYYKNGQTKLDAEYITHPQRGMSLAANVIIQGRWEIENDVLTESVESVSATPAALKEALEEVMRKGQKLPPNRVIEVNENHLVLENPQGEKTEYLRIKK
jgi:hypothetical protein